MEYSRECVKSDHRNVYVDALNALVDSGVPFMVGGAFAVWYYTGRWRDTHDMDVFTAPVHVSAAAEALAEIGFQDLGEQAAGDREWIYHAIRDDIIVDVIFAFANRVTTVQEEWIERGPEAEFFGVDVKFMPIEELVNSKIFTMNKHRCDWPDIMRLFRATCNDFNWSRLVNMLGEHWLLFAGLVDVFDWQFPADYACVPAEIRQELAIKRVNYQPDYNIGTREQLLDPWIHSRPEDICYWGP